MANVSKYSKVQIVKSNKYAEKRDLLNALLEDGKTYTLKEVDAMIEEFMKKAVK